MPEHDNELIERLARAMHRTRYADDYMTWNDEDGILPDGTRHAYRKPGLSEDAKQDWRDAAVKFLETTAPACGIVITIDNEGQYNAPV